MVRVVVTGIGLLSCLGNLQQTWKNIVNLKSGIKTHQIFKDFPAYPLGLIGKKPISINNLTTTLVQETILDANLSLPLKDCGVVIGSSRSCQNDLETLATQIYQQNNPSLNNINWLSTFPFKPSQLTASLLETQAPVFAPMAACSTGINAIAQGYDLIKYQKCERVIVGAVETPITKLTLAGFNKMGALSQTGCYPFDKDRDGFVLAEGGAMLMLESANAALTRQAQIYGEILGYTINCDGTHISTPEFTGKTAISAINKCLHQSSLTTKDIDYIHAHGTGTRLNDAREAKIIKSLFSDQVLVSSTKGATGHTLGASGAIATALNLMAIKHQQSIANIGLQTPAFDLNLVGKTINISLQHTLCFSFGFGGQNSALCIAKFD